MAACAVSLSTPPIAECPRGAPLLLWLVSLQSSSPVLTYPALAWEAAWVTGT